MRMLTILKEAILQKIMEIIMILNVMQFNSKWVTKLDAIKTILNKMELMLGMLFINFTKCIINFENLFYINTDVILELVFFKI